MKEKINLWLSKLSFRTGVIVLVMCILFHIIAFLPIIPWVKDWSLISWMNPYVKGLWWTAWIGIAHVFKYAGLAILGVEGYKRVKAFFRRKKQIEEDNQNKPNIN